MESVVDLAVSIQDGPRPRLTVEISSSDVSPEFLSLHSVNRLGKTSRAAGCLSNTRF